MEEYTKDPSQITRRERSGSVFRGFHLPTSQIIDLKEIPVIGILGTEMQSYVEREISFLRELQHINIVRLLDVVTRTKAVYMVLEPADMTLRNLMDSHPYIFIDPKNIKKYLSQILTGVAYCHSCNIVHQDIKPQNILVDTYHEIMKLTDFGSARKLDAPLMTTRHTQAGGPPAMSEESRLYMAAEFVVDYQYCSAPVDMWSVGCIFAEMVDGRPLFGPQGILSNVGTHTEGHWLQYLARLVPGLDPLGLDLLSRMLWANPSGRITAAEALNHPYLNPESML